MAISIGCGEILLVVHFRIQILQYTREGFLHEAGVRLTGNVGEVGAPSLMIEATSAREVGQERDDGTVEMTENLDEIELIDVTTIEDRITTIDHTVGKRIDLRAELAL